jgi:peptidyl-tRNA hydrolase, PTH1 family
VSEGKTKQKLIVGLGNPGKRYEATRHNMGFLVVKALAKTLHAGFKEEKRFSAYVAKVQVDDVSVHMLLPTTYMNESGQAVRSYLDFYRLPVSEMIAVVDDVALAFGKLRLRSSGSAGGHNGLKSIEAHLGTSHYARLRMGIGKDRKEDALADYVLDVFSDEEKQSLSHFIEEGANVLKRLLKESITQVMSNVNNNKVKS